jgi:hypothetical protein
MKITILLATLAAAMTAGSAIARPGPVSHGQSLFCATRESGNPHSKYCDYIEWSKWRQRGSWDSTLDNACLQNPAFVPGECGFNAQGQVLFGAHP